MQINLWSSPIEIAVQGTDHSRCVRNAREALACLKLGWPTGRDAAYAEARRKCQNALYDQRGNEEARASFIRAAMKAGLLRDPSLAVEATPSID